MRIIHILAAALLLNACATTAVQRESNPVRILSQQEYLKEREKTSTPSTLYVMSADWCKPCELVKPELSKLSRTYEGKLSIVVVDASDMNFLFSQGFDSLPAYILTSNNAVVTKWTGYEEGALAKKIASMAGDFKHDGQN